MCIKSSHCNILNIYTIFVDYNLISVGDRRTPGEGNSRITVAGLQSNPRVGLQMWEEMTLI